MAGANSALIASRQIRKPLDFAFITLSRFLADALGNLRRRVRTKDQGPLTVERFVWRWQPHSTIIHSCDETGSELKIAEEKQFEKRRESGPPAPGDALDELPYSAHEKLEVATVP